MWYLVEQYIVYLAIAFVIGIIVGWWSTELRKSGK